MVIAMQCSRTSALLILSISIVDFATALADSAGNKAAPFDCEACCYPSLYLNHKRSSPNREILITSIARHMNKKFDPFYSVCEWLA